MRSLMCFDEDNIADRDEFDFVLEDLEALYNRMVKNHPGITFNGRFLKHIPNPFQTLSIPPLPRRNKYGNNRQYRNYERHLGG